jgi:hypothetical protein
MKTLSKLGALTVYLKYVFLLCFTFFLSSLVFIPCFNMSYFYPRLLVAQLYAPAHTRCRTSVWPWTCPSLLFSFSRQLSVQVRAAAAHKVKDFCLALDKSIQEQVIMNHLLPCVKVILSFIGLMEFLFSF